MHGIAITLNTVLCDYVIIIIATLVIVPSDRNRDSALGTLSVFY